MTERTIPIRTPRAHLSFDIEPKGTRLRVRLDWLTRFDYYTAQVSRPGGEVLIAGRGLHPGVDVFQEIFLDIGKLFLRGQNATPDNLGRDNQIILET